VPAQIPSPAHAARVPRGAPVTAAQVPSFAPSHASHAPVQATSQQTPSTQWPLAQTTSALHARPRARGAAQVPVEGSQTSPAAQPALVAHDDAHAAPLQAYGAHDVVLPGAHAPAPLQLPAAVDTPDAQLAAPHVVPDGYAHAVVVVPSQAPPHDDLSVAQGLRGEAGALPFATGEQVPTFPATLHAWHWPVHATSQQTPSTHSPLAHIDETVHAAPCPSAAPHVCFVGSHVSPVAQSAFDAHDVLHAPDAQT
jgi:hypothetical protein